MFIDSTDAAWRNKARFLYVLPVGIKILAPTLKVAPAANDGLKVSPASAEQEHLEGGYPIKEESHAHHSV